MKLSIQIKFIISVFVTVLLIGSLILVLILRHEYNVHVEEAIHHGKLLAETLATPVLNEMVYESLGLVEEAEVLDNYVMEAYNDKNLNLKFIMILNEDNRIIAHNNLPRYWEVCDAPIMTKVDRERKTIVEKRYDRDFGGEILDIATPLMIGEKKWGVLRIGLSLNDMKASLYDTSQHIIVFAIILFIINHIFVILLSRKFVKPVKTIADTMDRVGSGNLAERVEIRSNDEFQFLGEQFNMMLERVQNANKQLKKAQEEALHDEKMVAIGKLSSGLAHEINNPLSGMLNCVNILLSDYQNTERQKKYLHLVREGLERISVIVDKLTTFSRKKTLLFELVSVADLVQNTIALIKYDLEAGKINISVDVEEGLPYIVCDKNAIQQVILNILINSRQAMPDGGNIRVDLHAKDEFIEVSIADTGVGMDDEALNKIFEPFYSNRPAGKGTGLGLSLSYGIVKEHGGEIKVESMVGTGSIFTIMLPIEQERIL